MRKEPRQARSRATVEVIVRAGARVLADRGWAGFTTNEVAEVAGVSIGSIYQYFPDKLVLIDAIRRHHLDDVLAVLRKAGQGGSLHQLIDDLVDGMVAVHSVHPALHRVLLDEVPGDAGGHSAHRAFEAEYLERYRAIVAMSGRGKGQAAGVMVQVLSSAMEGVIHGAARRGVLASPEIRRELVTMIRSYLIPGRQ